MKENPHKDHRKRMKEKFKKYGLSAFADHEKLEYLLYYAFGQKDTNPLAHTLIEDFGSLRNVFDADLSSLMNVKGVGEHSALLLQLIPEFSRYYFSADRAGARITSVQEAGEFIKPILYGRPNEELYVFCLDMRYRVIHYERASEGVIDSVSAHPRIIASIALKCNASHVLLAHNHPTGSIRPSKADISATVAIAESLFSLGIKFIDHIICSDNEFYSFTAENLIHHKEDSKTAYQAQYADWGKD